MPGYRDGNSPRGKAMQILKDIGEEGDLRLCEALIRLEVMKLPPPSGEENLRLTETLIQSAKTPGLLDRVDALGGDSSGMGTTGAWGYRPAAQSHIGRLIALIRPQVEAFGRTFWIVSALVMVGGIIALSMLDEGLGLWIHASPLFAVFSVIWGFRSRYYRVNELEMSCPFSQAQLLAARMALILAYNVGFGLVATALLGGFFREGAAHIFGRLVMSWLGPLFLLAGVTLLVSVRFGTIAGSIVSLALWGVGQFRYATLVRTHPPSPADLVIIGRQEFLSKGFMLATAHAEGLLILDAALLAVGLVLMALGIWQSARLEPTRN